MRLLSHDEYQAILKKELELMEDYLRDPSEPLDQTAIGNQLNNLQQVKEGGSKCLDCTLGKSLPH